MKPRPTIWARISSWAYLLMFIWSGVAAVMAWFYIGDLPDRIVSGSGPGGLRYAQKEAVWLYPFIVLGFMVVGLFTHYLRRVAPEMVNLSGRTKAGMDSERSDLQGAMIAVALLAVGFVAGLGPYRLWLINTGQVAPQAVFGLPTFVGFVVPMVLIFGSYLVIDRRYRE